MKTLNIEWRVITGPPRRIRTSRRAFLARREARARIAERHDTLARHARHARAHAGRFDEHDTLAKIVYNYWTKMVIRHQEAARVQRSLMAAEQAERERYYG